MAKEKLNIQTVRSYWIKEAEEALTVTEHLFEKKDYSYALFFGHLATEKMLKALYVDKIKGTCPSNPQFATPRSRVRFVFG